MNQLEEIGLALEQGVKPLELSSVKDADEVGFRVIDQGFVAESAADRTTISLSELSAQDKILLLPALREFATYLVGGLAVDELKYHDKDAPVGEQSRREWKRQQSKEVQQWLKRNRVSVARIGDVSRSIDALNFGLDILIEDNPDLKDQLSGIAERGDEIQKKVADLVKNRVVTKQKDAREYAQELALSPIHKDKSVEDIVRELREVGRVDEEGMVQYTDNDETVGFDALSIDEKIDLVEEVTQYCRDALQTFGVVSSPRETVAQ